LDGRAVFGEEAIKKVVNRKQLKPANVFERGRQHWRGSVPELVMEVSQVMPMTAWRVRSNSTTRTREVRPVLKEAVLGPI